MLLTATIILVFLAIGVAAVVGGHYAQRQELYIFGVVIIFLMGLAIIDQGIAVQTGVEVNETSTPAGNDTITSTTQTFQYDQTTSVWTNSIGLLCVIIAAGLAMTWFKKRKEDQQHKRESVEMDD